MSSVFDLNKHCTGFVTLIWCVPINTVEPDYLHFVFTVVTGYQVAHHIYNYKKNVTR